MRPLEEELLENLVHKAAYQQNTLGYQNFVQMKMFPKLIVVYFLRT